MSGDVDARVAGVRAAVDALAAALAERREGSEAWDELLPGMPGGGVGRDAVKAFLAEHVVDTAGAVEEISRISAVIGEINDFQATIAAAVEEQTATTGEMARSVAEVATASHDIAQNIDNVAAAVRTSTDGVTEARRATSELAELSGHLRQAVSRFRT